MRGQDLNFDQLKRLKASLAPKLGYLRKLKARMVQCQFPEHDRMLRDVLLAERGLADLMSEIETVMAYKRPAPDPFR